MKLTALKLDGFGALRGEFRFDASRVSVVVDDNERGKSTLLAAIAAALYGLDDDRRTHRMVTPLERWKPWDGGSYRIELELECENERYTIKRDFAAGTAEVWTAGGRNVTESFVATDGTHPVGKNLLGLDADEFEKCALVRQGELDLVVPTDERVRRQSTLHARLENAADTRGGDTNATEALQVLENAAASYTCDELGTTLKVETAIQRLEMKQSLLESELHTLEREREALQEPMAQLLAVTEEERRERELLDRLDLERRQNVIEEIRRKLDENKMRKRELAKLKDEAQSLSGAAQLPPGLESELRDTVSRHDEAARNIESLEQRRRDQQGKERQRLEGELLAFKPLGECTAEDADRCVALASELQRITSEDSRLRDEAFQVRDTLASQGHLPERIQFLQTRFDALTEDQQRLIRGQSDLALAFQTEVADLEGQRTEATETLRAIDAERHGKRLPGWVLTAIGFGTAVAGIALLVLHMQASLWIGMLATGAIMMMIGAPMLMAGGNARAADRDGALKRLSDSQRRLNQLRARRAESEVSIGELSRGFGYRDSVELMRDWAEYARVMDESAPVLRARRQMETLREQRAAAVSEVKKLLDRLGGGPAEPSHLEQLARSIRRAAELRKTLTDLDHGWSWIDEEKRVAETAASALRERAVRMLQQAGMTWDASKPWSAYLDRLAELSRGGRRLETLNGELIPSAEKRLMPDAEEAELVSQLGKLDASGPVQASALPRPAAEIDADHHAARERLDVAQSRREELRLQVEGRAAEYHRDQPAKAAERDRLVAALDRARRFQRAVQVARETIQSVAVETHRRWADWMNQRVAELLRTMETQIEAVRFGEDLDFSIRLPDGQQITRGRAMYLLSAGARDQLHLAVRLAVSEYLSRGQASLPLLVDDAFATSDDRRARAGMKLLLEHLSKRHQVIVVTCHRQRHELFAREDQKLWSERAQWIDAKAVART